MKEPIRNYSAVCDFGGTPFSNAKQAWRGKERFFLRPFKKKPVNTNTLHNQLLYTTPTVNPRA